MAASEYAENLRLDLMATNRALDDQIRAVGRLAERWVKPGGTVYDLQNKDGSFVLAPILATKAQVLSALVELEKMR